MSHHNGVPTPTMPIVVKRLPLNDYTGSGSTGSASGSTTPSRSFSRTFKTLPIVSKFGEKERERKSNEVLVQSGESLSYESHSSIVAKKLRAKKKEKERESTEDESDTESERLFEMITRLKKDVDTVNDTITRFATVIETQQRTIADQSRVKPSTTLDTMESESEESLFSYYCCCCCGSSFL